MFVKDLQHLCGRDVISACCQCIGHRRLLKIFQDIDLCLICYVLSLTGKWIGFREGTFTMTAYVSSSGEDHCAGSVDEYRMSKLLVVEAVTDQLASAIWAFGFWIRLEFDPDSY